MAVVGCHNLYAVVAGEPQQMRQHDFLFLYVVVLYFYVEIVAEQTFEFFYVPVRFGNIAREYRLRNYARDTRRKTNKPFGVRL